MLLTQTRQTPSTTLTNNETLIHLNAIVKQYTSASAVFRALNDVSVDISKGEFVAVIGKSGSGKSTLLNIIAGLDRPSSGEVTVAGAELNHMTEAQLALWRGRQIGVVFQFFQLLPILTVAENIMLPMDFCNTYGVRERQQRVIQLLDQVGIADQAHKLPSELSGGQQQRAAIARALANAPSILLADEPTGNLDSETADEVWRLFALLAQSGTTVIVVTHEQDVTQYVGRTITLADGLISGDERTMNVSTGVKVESHHA